MSNSNGQLLLYVAESIMQATAPLQDEDFMPTSDGGVNEAVVRTVIDFLQDNHLIDNIPVSVHDIVHGDTYIMRQLISSIRRKGIAMGRA